MTDNPPALSDTPCYILIIASHLADLESAGITSSVNPSTMPGYYYSLFTAQLTIDGFQMSIKRPTSGGQARDQEAAVQQIFHLERSSFFYL